MNCLQIRRHFIEGIVCSMQMTRLQALYTQTDITTKRTAYSIQPTNCTIYTTCEIVFSWHRIFIKLHY